MGCAPFHNYNNPERPYCKQVANYAWGELMRLKPHTLIIHAGWLFYQQQNPTAHLRETIAALHRALPQTHIYVIGNLPQWSPDLPDVMLRNKRGLADGGTIPNGGLRKLRSYDAQLKEATVANGGTFISAVDLFCPDHAACLTTATWQGKTELAVWDYGHPTLVGSTWLANRLLNGEMKELRKK
jgi:hypothetical protein